MSYDNLIEALKDPTRWKYNGWCGALGYPTYEEVWQDTKTDAIFNVFPIQGKVYYSTLALPDMVYKMFDDMKQENQKYEALSLEIALGKLYGS